MKRRFETILSKNRVRLKVSRMLCSKTKLEEEDAAKYMKDAVLPKEVKLHAHRTMAGREVEYGRLLRVNSKLSVQWAAILLSDRQC